MIKLYQIIMRSRLSSIDIGIITVVALSALIGLVRGITREFFGLVSWIGAVVTAYLGYPIAANVAHAYIKSPMLADGATYLGLFVIFLVLFSVFSQVLSNLIRDSGLSGIDRTLGFGFGIARGAILLTIIEIGMGFFVSRAQQPKPVQESRLVPLVYQGSDFTLSVLPTKFRQFICEKQRTHQVDDGTDMKTHASSEGASVSMEQTATQQAETTEAQAEDLAKLKPQSIDNQITSTAQAVVDTKNNLDRLLELGKEVEETATATSPSKPTDKKS